jgi:hypothetical protein
VIGSTASTSGNGVYGNATATSGQTAGIAGINNSPAGTGGYFQNKSTQAGSLLIDAVDASAQPRFTVDNQGQVNVTTGTSPNLVTAAVMPVNHARMAVTTSNVNQSTSFTVTWNFPFPDTNYTATCSPVSSSSEQIWYFQISSLTSTTVTVDISAYSAVPVTIHCMAVHD